MNGKVFHPAREAGLQTLVGSIIFVVLCLVGGFALYSILNVRNIPFPLSIQGSSQFSKEKPSEEVLLAVLRSQIEHAGNLLVLEAGAGAWVLQKCKEQVYKQQELESRSQGLVSTEHVLWPGFVSTTRWGRYRDAEWSRGFPICTDGGPPVGKDENKALRICHKVSNTPFLTHNQKLKINILEEQLQRETGTGSNAVAVSRQFLSNKRAPLFGAPVYWAALLTMDCSHCLNFCWPGD